MCSLYISATALLRAGRVEWFCCPVGCGVGFFEIGHLGGPRIRPRPSRARCWGSQDSLFFPLKPLKSTGPWSRHPKTPPDAPKTPPRRPQDPPRAAQERPRAPQDTPGPPKWSQVGANINLRWVMMLKTMTTPKLLKKQNNFKELSCSRAPKLDQFFIFLRV